MTRVPKQIMSSDQQVFFLFLCVDICRRRHIYASLLCIVVLLSFFFLYVATAVYYLPNIFSTFALLVYRSWRVWPVHALYIYLLLMSSVSYFFES